jgi:hypothetical protein
VGALRALTEGEMPPVLALAFGLIGGAVLLRWCIKEVQRVSADLDTVRGNPADPVDRETLPTLKRDPQSGEYRPS